MKRFGPWSNHLCRSFGGNVNSGGQRGLGTMTAPNPVAVKSAYKMLENAGVGATEIDTINGI
jgi:hypothetical protein